VSQKRRLGASPTVESVLIAVLSIGLGGAVSQLAHGTTALILYLAIVAAAALWLAYIWWGRRSKKKSAVASKAVIDMGSDAHVATGSETPRLRHKRTASTMTRTSRGSLRTLLEVELENGKALRDGIPSLLNPTLVALSIFGGTTEDDVNQWELRVSALFGSDQKKRKRFFTDSPPKLNLSVQAMMMPQLLTRMNQRLNALDVIIQGILE
jgi:hypothetical protein